MRTQLASKTARRARAAAHLIKVCPHSPQTRHPLANNTATPANASKNSHRRLTSSHPPPNIQKIRSSLPGSSPPSHKPLKKSGNRCDDEYRPIWSARGRLPPERTFSKVSLRGEGRWGVRGNEQPQPRSPIPLRYLPARIPPLPRLPHNAGGVQLAAPRPPAGRPGRSVRWTALGARGRATPRRRLRRGFGPPGRARWRSR